MSWLNGECSNMEPIWTTELVCHEFMGWLCLDQPWNNEAMFVTEPVCLAGEGQFCPIPGKVIMKK